MVHAPQLVAAKEMFTAITIMEPTFAEVRAIEHNFFIYPSRFWYGGHDEVAPRARRTCATTERTLW